MATVKDVGLTYARNAGADLSAKLHFLAKVDPTDGDLILAAAGTDTVIGVITEAAAADKPVTVQFGGLAKVKAGGTIVAGDRLTSDGSGQAIATTTAGNRVFGIALDAGASGNIVPVMLIQAHIAVS